MGEYYWFEYHCWESPKSSDAHLWYKSHQRVKVLSLEEPGFGSNVIERGKNGHPAIFKVQFKDGSTGDVFEDELMKSRNDFCKNDPPKPDDA